MNVAHKVIHIFGQVQGVFFRQAVKELADKLKLTGFVRNEPDGSVYIEVGGPKDAMSDFMKWCRKGPRWASVKRVEIGDSGPTGFKDFQIIYNND